MQFQEISLSDVISLIGFVITLLFGGRYVLLKIFSKNKHLIQGNQITGNLIGGNRIKGNDNQFLTDIAVSNKTVIKDNTVGGDLVAGDDVSQQ